MASSEAAPPQAVSVPKAPRPARRRAVNIRGREYPVVLPSLRDPRLHVAAVLLTLQVLGQTVLGFRLSIAQILACLVAGALIEFVVVFFKDHAIIWPASGLLTGNSTAFILRVPGTLHGQWWSTHGIEIFVGVVALVGAFLITYGLGAEMLNFGVSLNFPSIPPIRLDVWAMPTRWNGWSNRTVGVTRNRRCAGPARVRDGWPRN